MRSCARRLRDNPARSPHGGKVLAVPRHERNADHEGDDEPGFSFPELVSATGGEFVCHRSDSPRTFNLMKRAQ